MRVLAAQNLSADVPAPSRCPQHLPGPGQPHPCREPALPPQTHEEEKPKFQFFFLKMDPNSGLP